ncbi:MAG: hypothetical protein ACR2P9_03395 [Gammaproteobacteria bacterium]
MTNKRTDSKVTRKSLLDAIISGIKKAQNDYYDMSEYWVGDGPEYWITTYVARALWKISGDGTVLAEGASDTTRKEVGGRNKGRLPRLVKNKRYDIVVYWQNGKPRAVIEIKNQVHTNLVMGDVKRVIAALKAAQLRFGAIGYYYSAEDSKEEIALHKVRGYAKSLGEEARELAAEDKFKVDWDTFASTEDDHAWLAGCIVIERKQGNTHKKQ